MPPLRLDEDLHVHSTFSDGLDTIERNLGAAAELGLKRLGCVDHVRCDTTYVPQFVDAVKILRRTTGIELTIGIEAKILDASGALDLPSESDISGIDCIYVADHQFPGESGPVPPRLIRDAIETGALTPVEVVEQLVDATIATLLRHARQHRLVLGHLFSILPKLGLAETTVTDEAIGRVLDAARRTETVIEVSERWRCPSEHTVREAHRHGVALIASTDSHRAADIGRYTYVAGISASLDAAVPAAT